MVGGFCPLPLSTTADTQTGVSGDQVNALSETSRMPQPLAVLTLGEVLTKVSVLAHRAPVVTYASGENFQGVTSSYYVISCTFPVGVQVLGWEVGYDTLTAPPVTGGLLSPVGGANGGNVFTLQVQSTLALKDSNPVNRTIVLWGVDPTMQKTVEGCGGIQGRVDSVPHPAYDYYLHMQDSLGVLATTLRDPQLVAQARAMGALHRGAEKVRANASWRTAGETLAGWADEMGAPVFTGDTPETLRARVGRYASVAGRVSRGMSGVRSLIQEVLGEYFVSADVYRDWAGTQGNVALTDQKGVELVTQATVYLTRNLQTELPNGTWGPGITTVFAASTGMSYLRVGENMVEAWGNLDTGTCWVAHEIQAPKSGLPGAKPAITPQWIWAGTATCNVYAFRTNGYDLTRDYCVQPGEAFLRQWSSGYMKPTGSTRHYSNIDFTVNYDSDVSRRWPDAYGTPLVLKPPAYTTGLGAGNFSSQRGTLVITVQPTKGYADVSKIMLRINTELMPLLNKLLPATVDVGINVAGSGWTLDSSTLDNGTRLG